MSVENVFAAVADRDFAIDNGPGRTFLNAGGIAAKNDRHLQAREAHRTGALTYNPGAGKEGKKRCRVSDFAVSDGTTTNPPPRKTVHRMPTELCPGNRGALLRCK